MLSYGKPFTLPDPTYHARASYRTFRSHLRRARKLPSRARKPLPHIRSLHLYADDWQRTVENDCKYLGSAELTLCWRSDKGEDKFLDMCEGVCSSPKFSNLAKLSLRCEHLPLDSRFLRCFQQRPQLRSLDIQCWTYFNSPGAGDSNLLQSLTGLKQAKVDMSDSTAFPEAWSNLMKHLPQVQLLRLSNRGCGYPRLKASDLPRTNECPDVFCILLSCLLNACGRISSASLIQHLQQS